MEDKILTLFFDPKRWQAAIAKGVDKDIRKDQLYQLTKPETRIALYRAIREGRYTIAPPHTALIPKDTPGEYRTVYVNEPADRVLLSIANDLLFQLCPKMVHPSCRSYLKGTGCGKTVQEVSRCVSRGDGDVRGWKSDLSKYFDSVPLRYIDAAFDQVERTHGPSALIKVLRDYYHSDLYFDTEGNLQRAYQSLKQGCAVAAFLADAVLYHVDEKLASLDGLYLRYSDDMIFIGPDYPKAMAILRDELARMEMGLNPKKVEYLSPDKWFKFLGFSIRGQEISLSSSRIRTFQKEIQTRTVLAGKISFPKAVGAVNRFLYKGNGQYSWATQVLRICNVRKDLDTLNAYVMDCLRAVSTGKTRVGGIGYDVRGKHGCIVRGKGRNVTANRAKTPARIEGYLSIGCMQNALLTRKGAYDALVASL